MTASFLKRLMIAVSALQLLAGPAGATEYRFHVSCQSRSTVAVWNTGDVDPGREYLRFVTGLKNPNCSIGDFNQSLDANLPVEKLSGWEAVIQGSVPIIGLILMGVACRSWSSAQDCRAAG
jgi:hypothetical protein